MLKIQFYYLFVAALTFFSAYLYIAKTDPSIKHFGGTVTPTSRTWCRIVAAGDILMGYMALEGVIAKPQLARDHSRQMRCFFWYVLSHMVGFWHGAVFTEPHPGGTAQYWSSIVIVAVLATYWGLLHPPGDVPSAADAAAEPKPRGVGFIRVYYVMFASMSFFSSLLYVGLTAGTIKHFGGEVNPAAMTWCRIVASGDILTGVMSLEALFAKEPLTVREHSRTLRAFLVYIVAHMSLFWWGHAHDVPHPGGAALYPFSIVVTSAVVIGWHVANRSSKGAAAVTTGSSASSKAD